jgi:hypothetical protein
MELLIGILRFVGDIISAVAMAALSHFHEKMEHK